MSSVASPRTRRPTPVVAISGVSRYDRVAGLIVSFVIMLGLAVGILLFIWLAGRYAAEGGHSVPVTFHPGDGGDSASPDNAGLQLDAPSMQEIERETDLPLPGLRDSLSMVEQLVTNHAVELTNLDRSLAPTAAGGGASLGSGESAAFGSGGTGVGVARGDRWEIQFSPGITLEEYARQLDHFQIELAAVGPTGQVEYVRNLSKRPPTVERERPQPEARLFMSWREGSPRREADRKLLELAGVSTTSKQLVQFLSPELEQKLAALEQSFAGRDPRTVRSTRFGVRPANVGFEFFVTEQVPL
ncbi:MAG: hypothetical protein C0483_13985 [Pirellula sp.]|nr:hypothetical protein [Pirellula sp.]